MGEQDKVDFVANHHGSQGSDLVVAMQERKASSIYRGRP